MQDPAQQCERGGVVARDKGGDLLDPGGARVGDQLAGQRRPDPAPLKLVRDLEGDLGAVASRTSRAIATGRASPAT